MHIRDFTSEHSFNAAKDKLPYLKQLGINAIELMPDIILRFILRWISIMELKTICGLLLTNAIGKG